jgi:hypothetical protein
LAAAATNALQWVCLPGDVSGTPVGKPVSFAGDPFALDAHGVEHLAHGLRLRCDGIGRTRRAGEDDKNN